MGEHASDAQVSVVSRHVTEAFKEIDVWRTYRAPVSRLSIMASLAAALEILRGIDESD
jgi:hypothetical protein